MNASLVSGYSLKSLLVPLALLTALLPAVVLGIGSVVAVNHIVLRETLEGNKVATDSVVEGLETFLQTQVGALQVLAGNLSGLDTIDQGTATPFLISTRQHFPRIARLFLTDPGGTAFAGDTEEIRGGSSSIGLNYADRDYMKKVLQTKAPVIDRQVLMGRASAMPVMAIAVPVLDRAGNVRAVVVAGIKVETVQAVADRHRRGLTGRVFVASASGTPLAQDTSAASAEVENLSMLPEWSVVSNRLSGTVASYAGPSGREYVLAFGTVPASGWKVWSRRAHADMESEVYRAYQNVGIWVVAAIVAAIAAAFVIVRIIASPLDRLRATAMAVADGDLARRADEAGPREIAAVSSSINQMAASLQTNLESEKRAKAEIELAVNEFGNFVARVAEGDLSARTPVRAEGDLARLGEGLNAMADSLERLVGGIGDAVQSVSTSAAEILAGTSQQVSATSEEASAVKQTAATVEQVRQAAEVAARKTRDVAEMAKAAAATAADGRRSVEESIGGSESAKEQMEALAGRILEFSEQAQMIAEINATVSDLAEQSNLLAVNAGIEAAKAGEAGKGFGVVATEVKDLAVRCKEATAQVRHIVGEFQKSAHAAVIAAEQGVKTAESGVGIALRSGEAIELLEGNIATAAQAAQQILASAEQQESGMDQIALAMKDIEQASSQTVSATRQVERAARDLNQLAQNLTEQVTWTTQRSSIRDRVGA